MSKNKTNPVLTLSVAASLLNLHPRTLMLYEKESLIKPFRTATNRRLFSQDNLSQIQFIQYLVEVHRVNLAGARTILALLDKSSGKYPSLKKDFFPDFAEKELI